MHCVYEKVVPFVCSEPSKGLWGCVLCFIVKGAHVILAINLKPVANLINLLYILGPSQNPLTQFSDPGLLKLVPL